jgi:APA family basic amino acid/polyamine antiporter
VQAALACALVLAGSFEEIVGFFVPVVVLFLGLTVAALFVFRRRADAGRPGYLTPGYPLPPLAFLALVALLLGLLAGHNPRQALLGLLVTSAGLPVYLIFFRQRKERDTNR